MAKILVINGPNLARLGSREPEIYGTVNYDQLTERIHDAAAQLGHTVEVRQSDSESELIGWLHEAVDNKSDVVINPAAFTHYSYALRDAAAMVTKDGLRLIEVHISNPHSREEFRHKSVISAVASGVIAGFGVESYILALKALA
ncbi:MAG: type II 3-dehydroquinate dehydratase [Microbacteriaceae bacterium]|jgi:3-dehydroquinate dehydratase-2|nr:type II 3-dehydroquinate dehydratase [Microbacteriaceae bacterium]